MILPWGMINTWLGRPTVTKTIRIKLDRVTHSLTDPDV